MSTRVLLAGFVIAAALASAFAAEAEEPLVEVAPEPAEGYVGVRVGYLAVEGVDPGSFNVGVVGAYLPSEILAIEGSLDYHEAGTAFYDSGTLALQASLLFYPAPRAKRIRPYVLGGIGYYYSDYDSSSDIAVSGGPDGAVHDGGFHAGFGLDFAAPREWASGARLAFTIDARYLFTRDTDPARAELDGVLVTVGFKTFLH